MKKIVNCGGSCLIALQSILNIYYLRPERFLLCFLCFLSHCRDSTKKRTYMVTIRLFIYYVTWFFVVSCYLSFSFNHSVFGGLLLNSTTFSSTRNRTLLKWNAHQLTFNLYILTKHSNLNDMENVCNNKINGI